MPSLKKQELANNISATNHIVIEGYKQRANYMFVWVIHAVLGGFAVDHGSTGVPHAARRSVELA